MILPRTLVLFFRLQSASRAQGLRLVLAVAVLTAVPSVATEAGAQDTVSKLVAELADARSFKLRVQAANLLVRVDDPRAVPALLQALRGDRDYVVREAAAAGLSTVASSRPASRAVVERALAQAMRDPSPKVRRTAKRALGALVASAASPVRAPAASRMPASTLSGAPPLAQAAKMKIAVGHFADRSGQASPQLREQVRRQVMQQLQHLRGIAVVDKMEADVTFIVEGNIKRLFMASPRADVEATCAIDLVLSRPKRGILLVASGEATVQRLKARYRPQHKGAMEEEAMTHAVRSAHENLASFLARQ